MTSFLFFVAGVVVGLLGGWLLRGRNTSDSQPATPPDDAATTAAEPKPASTGDTAANPAERTAAPSTVTKPAADIAPVTIAKPSPPADTFTDTSTGAPSDASTGASTDASTGAPATAKPAGAGPAGAKPASASPIPAQPAAAEPVSEPVAAVADLPEPRAGEPAAAEAPNGAGPLPSAAETTPAPLAETPSPTPAPAPAPVAAEPKQPGEQPAALAVADDLTKIAGIGPKIASALAAAGITTYRQLADADVATLRAAVTGAGLRLAPTLPTWPERARQLAG